MTENHLVCTTLAVMGNVSSIKVGSVLAEISPLIFLSSGAHGDWRPSNSRCRRSSSRSASLVVFFPLISSPLYAGGHKQLQPASLATRWQSGPRTSWTRSSSTTRWSPLPKRAPSRSCSSSRDISGPAMWLLSLEMESMTRQP